MFALTCLINDEKFNPRRLRHKKTMQPIRIKMNTSATTTMTIMVTLFVSDPPGSDWLFWSAIFGCESNEKLKNQYNMSFKRSIYFNRNSISLCLLSNPSSMCLTFLKYFEISKLFVRNCFDISACLDIIKIRI